MSTERVEPTPCPYFVEEEDYGDRAIWDRATTRVVLYRYKAPEFFDWVASIIKEAGS